MGSQKLFACAGFNLNPPDLSLLNNWDYRDEPLAPGLPTFLSGLLKRLFLTETFPYRDFFQGLYQLSACDSNTAL
jgi:hypothetical protein